MRAARTTPGAQEVHAFFESVVLRSLRPAGLALAVVFGVYAVSYVLKPSEPYAVLNATSCALTAVVVGGAGVVSTRWRWSQRAPHVAAAIVCLAMNATMQVRLATTADPRQTANIMLYVVGIGALLLSWWWFSTLLVVAVAGWLAVALTAPPDPDWVNYGYTLFSSVVLGMVLVLVRRRQLRLLESARLELRELALVDPLTGLHNRRSLLHLGEQALRSADRAGRRMTLLFIDLDGMKRINDDDGHAAGDLALQQTARAMQATLRDADICVRLGGDEFCALLDGELDDVPAFAGRLRQALALQARRDGMPLRFGVSVGAAVSDPSGSVSVAELIERADAAMYQDKQHKGERLAVIGS